MMFHLAHAVALTNELPLPVVDLPQAGLLALYVKLPEHV